MMILNQNQYIQNRLKKLTILFHIQGPTYNTTLIKVLECFILWDTGNRGSEHKKC